LISTNVGAQHVIVFIAVPIKIVTAQRPMDTTIGELDEHWLARKDGLINMRPMIFAPPTLFALLLTGCANSFTSVNTTVAVPTGSSGLVVGGKQPVTNASIQLYSIGTMGDGTNATPMLTKAVTTDANGNFNIAGLYSCIDATEVYLTATGGDPTPGVTNSNLAMMTALGPCTSLSPATPIMVNELTTVAAVNALALYYMTSYSAVGSSSGDSASLDTAFTLASELVNPATGISPGLNVPSGYAVPSDEIDTLGDVIAPCVNSGGGIAGDGSACGNLFHLTTPPGAASPTNTIAALLDLVKNPGLNTSSLDALIPPDAPFQPQLTELLPNFPITVTPPTISVTPPTIPVTPPTGTGSLELSPTNITFPATPVGGTSPLRAVTLTNSNPYTVSVSNIAIVGANLANFAETNNCPAMLATGALCTIQILFAPLSPTQSYATLQVNAGLASIQLSGGIASPSWPATLIAANPSVYLNFNDNTASFLDQVSGLTFSTGGGLVTPSQAGFDKTTPSNTSAEFVWNAWNAAPNATLADIEWDIPWTMMIQIDRLNWNRTGTLVLASKGDISSPTSNWWKLTLGMVWGNFSQLCFTRNGEGPKSAQDGICTAPVGVDPIGVDAMPNGFNYNIVIEDAGTGSAPSMYINGLQVGPNLQIPGGPFSNSYADGFGFVNVSVSGGTGYADSTAFTSTGGGPNCNVTGFMWASSGVPYNGNWTPTGANNYGCTSTPTIVLTSPTGTGATITTTLAGVSMNSTKYPLMVPGYVSNGTYYGVAGTNNAAPPVFIDEFAIFPGNLGFPDVTALFYETKFYQGELYTTTTPPLVIFGSTACGPDLSGDMTLAMTIGAAKAGIIQLVGTDDDDGNPNGYNSVGWWRQMLDQAGFDTVPVSVGPDSLTANIGGCPAANITAYDPSTPQNPSSYESSVTMYRTVFAAHPTTAIDVLLTQTSNGYEAFVSSQPDNISPLTGLQLQAQNAANGGWINLFAGNLSLTWPITQTIFSNVGSMPVYVLEGTPSPSGPGILASRNAPDPMYLAVAGGGGGSDEISGWTDLNLAQVISPYFLGGAVVTYSGGTGYANSTPFGSTGGGPNCRVTGIMTASGGVPNGIATSWGAPLQATVWNGLGYGCTSNPTLVLESPTGAGVTLIASTTHVCAPSIWYVSANTATCSNIFLEFPSQYAQPGANGSIFQMFQNSLIDPTP
jgi:hypothetical protein